jgi:hypothetical protein
MHRGPQCVGAGSERSAARCALAPGLRAPPAATCSLAHAVTVLGCPSHFRVCWSMLRWAGSGSAVLLYPCEGAAWHAAPAVALLSWPWPVLLWSIDAIR